MKRAFLLKLSPCFYGFFGIAVAFAEPIPVSTSGRHHQPEAPNGGDSPALHFPTDAEYEFLGPRSLDTLGPAANERRAAEGPLWTSAFEPASDNPLTSLTRPVDPYLDFFIAGQFIGYEGSDPMARERLAISGGFNNLFQRLYGPNNMLFKAGPLYLDVPSVSAGVVYTSYSTSLEGESDHGWMGIIGTPIRLALQVTDTFYITSQANVFLTTQGRVGLFFGWDGRPTYLQLIYMKEIDDWTLLFYDRLQVTNAFLENVNWTEDSYDQIGLRRVGRRYPKHGRASSLFNDEGMALRNLAGVRASRPLSEEFTLHLGVEREDFWELRGGNEHWGETKLRGMVEYLGPRDLRWRPFGWYKADAYLDSSFLLQTVEAGVYSNFSRDFRLGMRVGYGHRYDYDENHHSGGLLLNVTLNQRLSYYTQHTVSVGRGYQDEIYGDVELRSYASYFIQQTVSSRLYLRGGVGVSHSGDTFNTWNDYEHRRLEFSGTIGYWLSDYMNLRTRYIHQRVTDDPGSLSWVRNIIQLTDVYRVTSDWHVTTGYQFDHSSSSSDRFNYSEHLLFCTVTKRF